MNDVLASLMLFNDDCLNDGNDKEAVTNAFKALCECNSIDQFVDAIKVFTEDTDVIDVMHYADPRRKMTKQDCSNKIKGDLFEVFTSVFFDNFQEGVFGVQYAPHDQKGWDFEGTNKIGNKCLIQAKYTYRGEYRGDLKTFFGETAFTEGVVNTGDGSISGILITTGQGVSSEYRNYMYDHDSFKIIDRKALKKCDFPGFWKTVNTVFREKVFVACDFE